MEFKGFVARRSGAASQIHEIHGNPAEMLGFPTKKYSKMSGGLMKTLQIHGIQGIRGAPNRRGQPNPWKSMKSTETLARRTGATRQKHGKPWNSRNSWPGEPARPAKSMKSMEIQQKW